MRTWRSALRKQCDDRDIERLQTADRRWTSADVVDVTQLESLLSELVVEQFSAGI